MVKNYIHANPPIGSSWVIGVFTGQQAKLVQAHADVGVGYFVLEKTGKNDSLTVKAAFRRVHDSPIPFHLTEVKNPMQIDELEKKRKQRQGLTREIYSTS